MTISVLVDIFYLPNSGCFCLAISAVNFAPWTQRPSLVEGHFTQLPDKRNL
jgi:hypothetical protein